MRLVSTVWRSVAAVVAGRVGRETFGVMTRPSRSLARATRTVHELWRAPTRRSIPSRSAAVSLWRKRVECPDHERVLTSLPFQFGVLPVAGAVVSQPTSRFSRLPRYPATGFTKTSAGKAMSSIGRALRSRPAESGTPAVPPTATAGRASQPRRIWPCVKLNSHAAASRD